MVLTGVVAVSLWWGFVREAAPLDAQGTRVELDFTRLPDGPVPTEFDGGEPAVVVATPEDPGTQPVIVGGSMTYQPTTEALSAGYYCSPDLGAPVRSMGVQFTFRPGAGTQGALAMVVSRGVEATVPPMIQPLPVHFVLTPVNWNISVSRADDAPLEIIAAGDLPQPLLEDGVTSYEASLTIDGADVTVDLPGVHRTVSDPRVSEWRGNYATFELFSNNGLTDSIASISKIWASAAQD